MNLEARVRIPVIAKVYFYKICLRIYNFCFQNGGIHAHCKMTQYFFVDRQIAVMGKDTSFYTQEEKAGLRKLKMKMRI